MSKADAESVLQTSLDAGTLDTTIDLLRTAGDESKLHLGKDGLQTRIVDAANVMMHDIDVSPSAFREVPSGSYTVGTNLVRLQDYTSKAGSDQTVDFSFTPAKRMLDIQYNGYEIDLACIDPDAIRQEPDLPDMDLPNHFTADKSRIQDALEVCAMASDHVVIECDADAGEVSFMAEGDTDDVAVVLDETDLGENTRIQEDTRAMYSIAYLVNSGERAPLFPEIPKGDVTVTIGDEFPIWFDYTYSDGNAKVRTMLAPRIET